jgi:hypothetical protein
LSDEFSYDVKVVERPDVEEAMLNQGPMAEEVVFLHVRISIFFTTPNQLVRCTDSIKPTIYCNASSVTA